MKEAPASPYAALGDEGVRRLVDRFYDLMDTLPEARGIRAMHDADLGPIRDKLYEFLRGWMGGPSAYAERFGPVNVPSAHAPYDIGPEEREAWLLCMQRALDESPLPEALAPRVSELMRRMAEMCQTRDEAGELFPRFATLRGESA